MSARPQPPEPTALSHLGGAVALVGVLGLGSACGDPVVIGEGQFSRPIALASDPAAPLPRMVWQPGASCPGPAGGCTSFCEGPPASCDADACLPLLIDSGTPMSLLPSTDGTSLSYSYECLELRAGADVLSEPSSTEVLAKTTASFRLHDAPIIRAPGAEVEGWAWEVGDDRNPAQVGGVIGGNILRDFAVELRHALGEAPSLAFFSQYPGSEAVLADQGRAYLRLQHPGRLLGRLLNDACEIGEGFNCRLTRLDFNSPNLVFESTRALVDACVAPPPCAVGWDGDSCTLSSGGALAQPCPHDQGGSATLVVATGVSSLVLFDDSAAKLLGPLDELPACASIGPSSTAPACSEGVLGRLNLPGWAALDELPRLRIRALGVVEGLEQATGTSPCQRLRDRFQGLLRQCEGFVVEGRPIQPSSLAGTAVGTSALVLGEYVWSDQQVGPDPNTWIETLIVPASAAPVIALRREIVPEGAQPDGLVGGTLLRGTETVLDFTEALQSPGLRVRCLDPGAGCLALPTCTRDEGDVEFDGQPGRTSCCYGLPPDLVAEVVLQGVNEEAPRLEDACCPALPPASLTDLQSLDLCTGVELP